MTLFELMDHVVTGYHEPLCRALPGLIERAHTVERVHADRAGCPHGLGAALQRLNGHLRAHLAKEANGVFPLIREGRGVVAYVPLRDLEREHLELRHDLALVHAALGDDDPPADACPTWRGLHQGVCDAERALAELITLENRDLFRRALLAEGNPRAEGSR